jgi:hypothetical protein
LTEEKLLFSVASTQFAVVMQMKGVMGKDVRRRRSRFVRKGDPRISMWDSTAQILGALEKRQSVE